MKKRFLTMVVAFVLLFCAVIPDAHAITYYIELTRTEVDLQPGQKTTLHTRITPVNLQAHSVIWYSSNDMVASVNQNGVVYAKTAGMALISAEIETGAYASCYVNVSGNPVTIVTISESDITLQKDELIQLNYTINTDADDRQVRWSSTDKSVADVNQSGLVKAFKGGECDIVLTAANGITAKCHVTVPVSVTEIKLLPQETTVGVGESVSFDAYVFPGNAQERDLTWVVSNEKCGIVDENGCFTAKAKGKVKIKAQAPNGVSATSQINIVQYPETVELNASSLELTNKNKSANLKVRVLPNDAEQKTVKWASSDESVAVVNNGSVTAKGFGECVIKAYTANGKYAECTVDVRAEVASVKLDKSSYTISEGGESIQAFAEIQPQQAEGTKLQWLSSDENIVTVDENGVLTAVSAGDAQIKVSSENGQKSIADVHVKEAIGSFAFDTGSVTIGVYCTKTLKIESDSLDKGDVAYTSSNTDIAIVNSDGTLVGKSVGECVITATLGDDLAAAQIDVIVVENTLDNGKVIALTFDDGPSENTLNVLEQLSTYGINATFFMVGKKAEDSPDTVKAVFDSGNEIGNRTYKNGNLENGTVNEALEYIHGCDDVLYDITGKTPAVLRAPGEGISYERATEIKGDRIFIGYTVDSGDVFAESAEEICETVLERVKNDSEIILMHDTQAKTAEALKTLVPELLARGYRFVTVSQMMNMVPDNNDSVYDGIYLED